jgi:tetratricopeptide (TPR) repeat protein
MRRLILLAIILMFAFGNAATPAAADDREICADGTGDAAIAACTRRIKSGKLSKSNLAIVYNNRAVEWRKKGDLARAISDYDEAIRNDPNYAEAHSNRGNAYRAKGDLDRAIADYSKAIRLKPNFANAYYNRGLTYRDKEDVDRAISDFTHASRANPSDPDAYFQRALLKGTKNDLDGAIADYSEAIRRNPNYAAAYFNRGNAHGEKGSIDAAIADYDQSIRIDPTDARDFYNRANMKVRKNDFDGAIADYSEAVRLNPKHANAYFNRADTYDEIGNLDAALADYDQAIRLTPTDASAYYNRSSIKEKMGDLDGAYRDIQRFVALSPDDPDGPSRSERLRKEIAARPATQSLPDVATAPPDAAPKAVAADPGRRVALVIGNSAYTAVARLPNPQRDAETVAAALRRTGFQSVTVATDLTREKLISALIAFAREADKADWGLVYYAGHGIELGGVNYLIPIDAKLATDRDVELEAVPLNQVLGAVERAGRLRLVLLDACRDNPFASQMRRTLSTRSVGRGLASVEPEAGTLVVYAAKHGETALDGDAGNSPFVSALVKNLGVPGLEIRRLFDHVRDDVLELTKRRQQPFSYGSLPGRQDFFFVQK